MYHELEKRIEEEKKRNEAKKIEEK